MKMQIELLQYFSEYSKKIIDIKVKLSDKNSPNKKIKMLA
jgi:hypothetical protein